MQSTHTINVAGLAIKVYIDSEFENIQGFISKFEGKDTNNQAAQSYVYISKAPVRNIRLSQNWDTLFITGDEIDDLTDPFNLIGIIQAVFRFTAIHLAKNGIFLLHGSASAFNNQIICFGDDGGSTAKTLGSLETALESKQYVADEFCFFDTRNGKVFGYPFVPIHIRPTVEEHLKSKHNLVLPIDNYKKTAAGEFINPHKLFRLTSGKLNSLLYIHFSNTGSKFEKLSPKDTFQSFKFCIASHIAKLLYPELDRMQFISTTDTTAVKVISQKLIDEIVARITQNQIDLDILQKFSSYKVTVSQPCQIVPFLTNGLAASI